MTRVNSSIEPLFLSDEHLLAEHREIKRLPSVFRKAVRCGSTNRIPKEFRLGEGHVLFFMDKMSYVFERYKSIHKECIRRDFSVEDYSSNFDGIDDRYCNDWIPNNSVRRMLVDRISERILSSNKKCFHYCGEKISKENTIKMLKGYEKL